MKKLFFALSILIAAMVACNSVEEMPNPGTLENNNNVEDLVRAFANNVNNTPEYKLIITGKTVDRYVYTGKGQNMTISASTAPLTRALSEDEFEISTVTFTIDNNEGFAVVGRTGEFTKVYYFTDNGTVESAREIEPVEIYLDEIPRYCADDLASGAGGIGGFPWGPTPDTTDAAYIPVGPIVKTKWDQGVPYNQLVPECHNTNCQNGGHCLVGCQPIAVGQFLARRGSYINNGQRILLYDVKNDSTVPTGNKLIKVCNLLKYAGEQMQTRYSCTSSITDSYSAVTFLNQQGYSMRVNYDSIHINCVIRELENGYPHLMRGEMIDSIGSTDYRYEGHIWILDGIYGLASNPYFHCNWGWGGACDGWVAGNPYTAGSIQFNYRIMHYYQNQYYY